MKTIAEGVKVVADRVEDVLNANNIKVVGSKVSSDSHLLINVIVNGDPVLFTVDDKTVNVKVADSLFKYGSRSRGKEFNPYKLNKAYKPSSAFVAYVGEFDVIENFSKLTNFIKQFEHVPEGYSKYRILDDYLIHQGNTAHVN